MQGCEVVGFGGGEGCCKNVCVLSFPSTTHENVSSEIVQSPDSAGPSECRDECSIVPIEESRSPDDESDSPVKLSRRSSRSHCFVDDIINTQIISLTPAVPNISTDIVSKDSTSVVDSMKSEGSQLKNSQPNCSVDDSYKRKKVNPSSLNTLPRRESLNSKSPRVPQHEGNSLTRSATDSNIPTELSSLVDSLNKDALNCDDIKNKPQKVEDNQKPSSEPTCLQPLNSTTKLGSINGIREATVKSLKCPYSQPKLGGSRNGVKINAKPPLEREILTTDEESPINQVTLEKDSVRFDNSPPSKISSAHSKEPKPKLCHVKSASSMNDKIQYRKKFHVYDKVITDLIRKCKDPRDSSTTSSVSALESCSMSSDLRKLSSRKSESNVPSSSKKSGVKICSLSLPNPSSLEPKGKLPNLPVSTAPIEGLESSLGSTVVVTKMNKIPRTSKDQCATISATDESNILSSSDLNDTKSSSENIASSPTDGGLEELKYIDEDEHNNSFFSQDSKENATTGRRSSLPLSAPLSLDTDFQDLAVLKRWTCSKCSYVNQVSSEKCESCGLLKVSAIEIPELKVKQISRFGNDEVSKPRKKIERPKSVAVAEYWSCPVCTLQNPLYSTRCQACQWDKNKEYKVKSKKLLKTAYQQSANSTTILPLIFPGG
jgi:hypothetical protein